MQYAELQIFTADTELSDILVAELAEYPFESFVQEPASLTAYIPAGSLSACRPAVEALLDRYGARERRFVLSGERDWNAAWEAGFTPVDVEGRIHIRAPHHDPAPEGVTEVIVLPRMAFGTGHHATTCLMAGLTADMGVAGRRGLDLGSGTGVLAILAVKCGAAHVDAVDTDEWAERNCRENAAANGVADRVESLLGDVGRVEGRRYGFVLANINRNVLVACMPAMAETLVSGGLLALSGFLEQDVPLVVGKSVEAGLTHRETRVREGWAALLLTRGGEAPGVEEL